jgi:hypothetical protein
MSVCFLAIEFTSQLCQRNFDASMSSNDHCQAVIVEKPPVDEHGRLCEDAIYKDIA